MKRIYLGLSTHRRIAPEAIEAVNHATHTFVKQTKDKIEAEGNCLVMLNSLAEGGDTLLCRIALSLGIPYIAVLPRTKDSYAEDFSGDALQEFLALCDSAESVIVTPDIEKADDRSLDYGYRQAGIYVAAKSDIFLALWDGVCGKPNGCGAAEAYGFAKDASYQDPDSRYPNKPRILCHILTPRPGQDSSPAGKTVISQNH